METAADTKLFRKITYPEFCSMVIEFMVCGFCGWLYETILASFIHTGFEQRGSLHIPVLPVYGAAAFILIPILGRYSRNHQVFLTGAAVTTVTELVCSFLSEIFIHERLWDYSGLGFSFFSGRISLPSSLIFGFLCLLLIRGVHPGITKYTERMPEKTLVFTGSSFMLIMIIDLVISLSEKFITV